MEAEGKLSWFKISTLALILNINLDNLPHYFFYCTGRVIASGLSSQIANFEKLDYPSSWVKVKQSRYRPGVAQRVPGS
jgi:hypothetical protein